jgi:predicted amidohydrolase YtcJ
MRYFFILGILLLCACSVQDKNDNIIYFNGHILTMNEGMQEKSVMVISAGKIVAVGGDELLKSYKAKPENMIDLKSQYVYPGLIDAHCHFYGYAKTLLSCNLVGTRSWEEVLEKMDSFSGTTESAWLTGRGWDQNDWTDKKFPDNTALNKMFPDRPVILKRIDGHAAICNKKALDLAGISMSTQVPGGEIVVKESKLSGILIDNAVELVEKVVLKTSDIDLVKVLKQAEAECFSLGLTTLADAGLDLQECLFLDSLGRVKQLSIYLSMMLNPTEPGFAWAKKNGVNETDHSKICGFKIYADGALGSRGAKLKHDYCDREGHSGMLLSSKEVLGSYYNRIYALDGYQANTHCIGDSANRLVLELYRNNLKPGNDRRWRIEHAQIIDTADIRLFKEYNIIPSVQPTHATSDAPWVIDRICAARMAGAYAYQSLLAQNHYIALGTDFPVEYLNPLFTFYSAVFRENANNPGQPAFLLSEGLTAEQALKGMTIWAAKACKLEHRKGSLEKGKDADFVILDRNLLKATKEEVLKTKVVHTYRMGQQVF